MVGEEQDEALVAEVGDRDLADGVGVGGQSDLLVEHARMAVAAPDVVQLDASPVGVRSVVDLGEDLPGAAAEGQEPEVEFVDFAEAGAGGEGGVEDQFAGMPAGALAPPVGEFEGGAVAVLAGDGGLGEAEGLGVGGAGEEGEQALPLAGAFGDVVLADEGVVAVVGDGVEVEVEGLALASLDAYIGWDANTRSRQLHRVVGLSRNLILPWVRVSSLASHALGLAARQLPEDWERLHGYRPVLLETYVGPIPPQHAKQSTKL